MTWVADLMLRTVFIMTWIILLSGTAVAQTDAKQEIPQLFPGSKNPMKKWAVEPIADVHH